MRLAGSYRQWLGVLRDCRAHVAKNSGSERHTPRSDSLVASAHHVTASDDIQRSILRNSPFAASPYWSLRDHKNLSFHKSGLAAPWDLGTLGTGLGFEKTLIRTTFGTGLGSYKERLGHSENTFYLKTDPWDRAWVLRRIV